MFAGKGWGQTSETFAWEDLKFDGSLHVRNKDIIKWTERTLHQKNSLAILQNLDHKPSTIW